MYLLFVDESGTHAGAHPFVLGGLAVHEDDAARMQKDLDQLVVDHLGVIPPNLDEFEVHAGEMRNAKKAAKAGQQSSIWASYSRSLRHDLLDATYDLVRNFVPTNEQLPHALFGVVVDSAFRSDWKGVERERFAYEVLLNKFDVMLKRRRVKANLPNRGLVIHDRRVVAERDIQQWTAEWRIAAGTVGKIRNLADVPLFTDSRATRLLQVADIVSYALYRRYNSSTSDSRYLDRIWDCFDDDAGVVHGCVHYTPSYGAGSCECVPCRDRLLAESRRQISRSTRRRRDGRQGMLTTLDDAVSGGQNGPRAVDPTGDV